MLNIISVEMKFLKLGPVADNLTIVKLEMRISQILKDLVDNNELSQENYNLIRPVGSINLVYMVYQSYTKLIYLWDLYFIR